MLKEFRELIYPPVPRPMTESDIPRTANLPTLVTVTADATIHTKGAWSTIIAATTTDVTMLKVYAGNSFSSGAASDMLLDIGTGTAASETVIIPDLNCGFLPAITGATCFIIPVRIPIGSRIAARCQALITADTVQVGVDALRYQAGWEYFTSPSLLTYGANASLSRGVTVVCGTAGAEGAWTEITAATTRDHWGLAVSLGGASDISVLAAQYTIDIGVGAGGSEVVIATDRLASSATTETVNNFTDTRSIYPLHIPGGSRLALRISTDAATQSLDATLTGLD